MILIPPLGDRIWRIWIVTEIKTAFFVALNSVFLNLWFMVDVTICVVVEAHVR